MTYLHEVLAGAGPSAAADVIANPILRERVAAFRRSFGDLQITPQVVVASDDHAAVHFSARGIHRGTYHGIEPTGRPWTASCGAVYRIENGRIADFWLVWDALSILEQIGAFADPRPTPPRGSRSMMRERRPRD